MMLKSMKMKLQKNFTGKRKIELLLTYSFNLYLFVNLLNLHISLFSQCDALHNCANQFVAKCSDLATTNINDFQAKTDQV